MAPPDAAVVAAPPAVVALDPPAVVAAPPPVVAVVPSDDEPLSLPQPARNAAPPTPKAAAVPMNCRRERRRGSNLPVMCSPISPAPRRETAFPDGRP